MRRTADEKGSLSALAGAAATGYLIGTVPSADVAARLATGGATDLRTTGSGNPGAANAMAALGKGWGYSVVAADIAKGALACVAGRALAGGTGANVGGTAAVMGHCYPVWNGFRGGKGVAVSAGQCLATFPAYLPLDLAVAWAVARYRGKALPATVTASALWVTCGFLWWWRRWPNGWGPEPGPSLPLSSAVTSAVILVRFAAARSSAKRPTASGAGASA